MRYTKIVTSFIKNNDKVLLLKRSDKVKSMKGLWAGVSGLIEHNEIPLNRAKIEIFEEIGLKEDQIKILKSLNEMRISSPQYKNHEWVVYPFLFTTENLEIKLNWENSDYCWINPKEITKFETVPNLDKVLFNLI